MSSTPNSNSNDAVNTDMDALEEGLAATSPPPPSSSNRSSAVSATAAAFSLADDPSPGNRHHAREAPTVTIDQPGAEPEVAAATPAVAGTAPTAVSATGISSTDGPPPPIDMIEEGLVEGSSASAASISPLMDSAAANAVAASASGGRAPPFGLECVDDDDGPPVLLGMNELGDQSECKKRRTVELMEDDGGPGDSLNAAELAASCEQKNAKTKLVLNNNSPSVPFDPFSLEEELNADQKKRKSIPSGVESNMSPAREEIEVDGPSGTSGNDAGGDDLRGDRQTPQLDTQMNIESEGILEESNVDTGGANYVADTDLEQDTDVGSDLGHDIVVPEAFPVEERSDDGIIIHGHAEPLLPWWKQRRTKSLLGAFIIVIAILSISLGIPLSLKESAPVLTDSPSASPTKTISPSGRPSYSPSFSPKPTLVPSFMPSFTPSDSPSACVNKIATAAKKIDLGFDDPRDPRYAIDGNDMVVVALQGGWDGPVFMIFYTFANGEWQRINTFVEDSLGTWYDVALSGTTAIIGFKEANDNAGTALIYEKGQYGEWELMEDPLIRDVSSNHRFRNFGHHVDIDGDLACLEDQYGTYLFRRGSSKWVQYGSLVDGNGEIECRIAGDTIVAKGINEDLGFRYLQLYRYNQEMDGVVPIQDPIRSDRITKQDLSNDYLVMWDSFDEDAIIYRREETNQTYTFLQQLNISGQKYNAGLAIDNDILVVAANNNTLVFMEQADGKWEEEITLGEESITTDNSATYYALSGRSLLTRNPSSVYYFDIEDCSQAMPTQRPSLSTAPIASSSSPSLSPSATWAPSSSSSPTETCYWVQVAIAYDRLPWQTTWELRRVVGDDGVNSGVVGDTTLGTPDS